jgi:hypothetical protein
MVLHIQEYGSEALETKNGGLDAQNGALEVS